MPADLEGLLSAALTLPPTDRAALVDALLTSLDRPGPALDRSWAAGAESRLAAFQAGAMGAIPAEDVFEEPEGL